MKESKLKQEKGAIELIEESIHLLRVNPWTLLPAYYMGSLPFILGLLYFWADMSKNPYAASHCSVFALGLAVLFVWMKTWHSVFMHKVRSSLRLLPEEKWSIRKSWHNILIQAVVQPLGFLVLPVGLIALLPFAWLFAFFQHMSLISPESGVGIMDAVKHATHRAKLWPRQNHVLLSIFLVLGIVVFFNLATGIYSFFYLLKVFLGIETFFTLTWRALFNTTYLAVVLGLTYLCIDPLLKTVYVLRGFYAESIRSGEDLLVALKRFAPSKPILLFLMGAGMLAAFPNVAKAAQSPDQSTQKSAPVEAQVPAQELQRSVQEVLKQPEFAWRMPGGQNSPENADTGLLDPLKDLVQWLKPILRDLLLPVYEGITSALQKIIEWLAGLLPSKMPNRDTGQDFNWIGKVKILLFVVLCIVASILGIYFKRLIRDRKTNKQDRDEEQEQEIVQDLTDDGIKADELPADRWLALAEDMISQGSLKLGMRAVYLATLASLADQELIRIAKHKSNRDYYYELRRRLHDQKECLELFSAHVNYFDSVWYGARSLDRNDVESFLSNHERITGFAR